MDKYDEAGFADDATAHESIFETVRQWTAAHVAAAAKLGRADKAATAKLLKQLERKHSPKQINAFGPNGSTPLMVKCFQGNATDVEALLALGADPCIEGNIFVIIFGISLLFSFF